MKFTMTKIAAGLILGVAATGAQAINITNMSVTGGDFILPGLMQWPTTFTYYGTGAANLIGYHNGSGDTIARTAYDPESIVAFAWGIPNSVSGLIQKFNTVTAASRTVDMGPGAPGLLFGGPPVSASVTSFTNGSTLTVDLRSFFMTISGGDAYAGSGRDMNGVPDGSFALGTLSGCGGGTCNYSISWNSYLVGGPFDGTTSSWVMTGVVAVPEASTYGMMLAGLGLVGLVARRRKMMA